MTYASNFSMENAYTHIMPYVRERDEEVNEGAVITFDMYKRLILLPEVLIKTGLNANFKNVLPFDVSDHFQDWTLFGDDSEDPPILPFEQWTEEKQEEVYAEMRFLTQNESLKYGTPKVSYSISFASAIGSTDKTLENLEKVMVGDSINLEVPQFGVLIPQRCVKTTFDCLRGRYTSAEFGSAKKGIESAVLDAAKNANKNSKRITEERFYVNRNFKKKS